MLSGEELTDGLFVVSLGILPAILDNPGDNDRENCQRWARAATPSISGGAKSAPPQATGTGWMTPSNKRAVEWDRRARAL